MAKRMATAAKISARPSSMTLLGLPNFDLTASFNLLNSPSLEAARILREYFVYYHTCSTHLSLKRDRPSRAQFNRRSQARLSRFLLWVGYTTVVDD
jgi:hypothetical protein